MHSQRPAPTQAAIRAMMVQQPAPAWSTNRVITTAAARNMFVRITLKCPDTQRPLTTDGGPNAA